MAGIFQLLNWFFLLVWLKCSVKTVWRWILGWLIHLSHNWSSCRVMGLKAAKKSWILCIWIYSDVPLWQEHWNIKITKTVLLNMWCRGSIQLRMILEENIYKRYWIGIEGFTNLGKPTKCTYPQRRLTCHLTRDHFTRIQKKRIGFQPAFFRDELLVFPEVHVDKTKTLRTFNDILCLTTASTSMYI